MKIRNFLWLFAVLMLVTSCTPARSSQIEGTETALPEVSITRDEAPSQTPLQETETPSPEPKVTATSTAEPFPSVTSTKAPSETPVNSSVSTPEIEAGPALIITHLDVMKFEQIPDEYIQRASQLVLLFRHASVGQNIDDGLDCLMNNFASRPNFCDRDLASADVIFDPKYDRSNWVFKLHAPLPNPNPGWWNKVGYFIEDVQTQDRSEPNYDYISFVMGYVDALEGGNIDEKFFDRSGEGTLPSILDLEALEAQYPDKKIIYWTLALARSVGTPDSASFNEQMRQYAVDNGRILMDIADIESHQPDGIPCFDNAGRNIPAICQDYTDEVNAGHLNSAGRLRMAKAFWVMMAKIAGWEG